MMNKHALSWAEGAASFKPRTPPTWYALVNSFRLAWTGNVEHSGFSYWTIEFAR